MENTENTGSGSAEIWLAVIIAVVLNVIHRIMVFPMKNESVRSVGTLAVICLGIFGMAKAINWSHGLNNKNVTIQSVTIKANVANVRKLPTSKGNKPIDQVKRGDKFKVLKSKGNWVQIDFDSTPVWVHVSLCKTHKLLTPAVCWDATKVDTGFYISLVVWISMFILGIVLWCKNGEFE